MIRKRRPVSWRLPIDSERDPEDNRPQGTPCKVRCWAGPSGNHCGVCHNTFRHLGDFDNHRQDGWCYDPVKLGYALEGGLWATEASHDKASAFGARVRARSASLAEVICYVD